ncbi:hypothetical protein M7I_2305 [Glarea lozoyensis 74030]|uniref:Uncharacterized protein n=1 Tax=Glarea lozoyensis (strain ATCC 74030 / MF5533) TaxID=1104152 RepID=H0EIF0_GLAL7|nr:hypothetical protein M7I_2305 [Glarea lozoyensis 74030]
MASNTYDQLPTSLEEVVSAHKYPSSRPKRPYTGCSGRLKVGDSQTVSRIMKIRKKSLGEEDVQALLTTLINWLIRCLEISEGQLVLRKLCSTLVNCIKHLIYCVSVGSALPYESSQDAPDVQSMIQQLPDRKAVAIFWFASTLVEEVGKTDSNSMKQ